MSTRTPATPSARTSLSGRPGAAETVGQHAGSAFTGTGALVRLALRRDRILIPSWVLLFVVMAWSSAAATINLYPDVTSRIAAAAAVNHNTALRALYGPVWNEASLGEISLFKLNALGAALVAVLSLLLITRHTRAEEEQGRLELLGAGVTGRFAALTAAMVVVLGTDLALAVLTWASLVAAGLPAAGAAAFGASWALAGCCFAAVAAVTAQLSSGARAANGLAAAVLGASYVVRAIGDAAPDGGPRWLSWLSPVGWAEQMRAFADTRWWVLGIGVLFTALLTIGAYGLLGRRDLGSGLLADSSGPARASRRLRGPISLAVRLQRGTLLAWTAAYTVLGLVLGNLATSAGDFLNSPQAREFLQKLGGQKGVIDAFFSTEFSFAAVITSVFAIQSVLRLRSEEAAGRADPVLGTAIERPRWVASHLLVSVLGSAWLLGYVGALAGIGYGAQIGDMGQVARLLGAALAQLPAVLVMAGLTLAAFGVSPRLAIAGWAALVVFLVIGELGPLIELDQRVMDVSPFAHVPKLPGGEFSATPLIWLAGTALALLLAGFVTLQRRDLE
jgi:ABC-2 type transport system permease protein